MGAVVVGVEVSASDIEPLRWAAEYCRTLRAELVAVVGFGLTQAECPPECYDATVTEVRQRAAEEIAAAGAGAIRVDVRYGEPGDVVIAAAADHGADVVVVGAHGTGGFRHLGIGTVAHHVAHRLTVPLVVVPAAAPPLAKGTIVVGLDGSPGDLTTLDWAVRVAEASGAQLRAVYASDPMASSYPHPFGATLADQAEQVVLAEMASVRADAHLTDVDTIVEIEYPVDALRTVADQQDAALVVVGRKGAGHLGGLLLGRTPAELPFVAHRPVAIVPR